MLVRLTIKYTVIMPKYGLKVVEFAKSCVVYKPK